MTDTPITRPGAVSVAESRVVATARVLLSKLDAVHRDPRFQAVWVNAEIHGMTYSGLSYDHELEDLRAAIGRLDQDRGDAPRGD